MSDKVIAVQVGAASLVDEGVDAVLDELQQRASANMVFFATPSWTRATGGRQIPGVPLADHGPQEYDEGFVGGNHATVHEDSYRATRLGPVGRAPDHGDRDLLAELLAAAHARDMKVVAWMEESFYELVRKLPGFASLAEIDARGRRTTFTCINHPDFREWWLAVIDDYCRHYRLDGFALCSERTGPLAGMLGARHIPGGGCFCDHCRPLARERGVDVERARAGINRLRDLFRSERAPVDGWLVAYWRVLLEYPDVLAFERHWAQSQLSFYAEIFGTVKALSRRALVGWHIHHGNSFNPFYRATQDYAEIAHYADFIKPVAYHTCAGPRFTGHVHRQDSSILGDLPAAQRYAALCAMLGYDDTQPPFEDLQGEGFNAEYVRRETRRALDAVASRCEIWPGIDIDIPAGAGASSNPETVRDAVAAALDEGAQGVVLSRKYSEMQLANLTGAGDGVRAAGGAG